MTDTPKIAAAPVAVFREDRKARRRRLTERLEALRERTNLLELELRDYTNDYFRVCIFGSARIKAHDDIYKITEQVAFLLGREGIDVLTGGGPGLMEAANKGVLRGRTDSGSKSRSYGISIDVGFREPPSEHLDIRHHHRRFSSRLDDFMRLSHATVVTPGGIGTMLELFFCWQLLQFEHIPERPLILVGKAFWSGLMEWVEEIQVKRGLVSPSDMRWVKIADTPEEALSFIVPEHQKFLEEMRRRREAGLPPPKVEPPRD
ncbi:MAG: LOG family protein [Deltaproteobacteria bacterium]|nr:LOG family protein [Deltaproteobacteria bacterium]